MYRSRASLPPEQVLHACTTCVDNGPPLSKRLAVKLHRPPTARQQASHLLQGGAGRKCDLAGGTLRPTFRWLPTCARSRFAHLDGSCGYGARPCDVGAHCGGAPSVCKPDANPRNLKLILCRPGGSLELGVCGSSSGLGSGPPDALLLVGANLESRSKTTGPQRTRLVRHPP